MRDIASDVAVGDFSPTSDKRQGAKSMEGSDPTDVGRRYARVNSLRVELTTAVVAGDFSQVSRAANEALELVNRNLAQFSDLDVREATPYKAQAAALLGDMLVVASTAPAESTIVEELVTHADRAVRDFLDPYQPTIASGMPFMPAPRLCPHHRPSYDGNCLSIPPCP